MFFWSKECKKAIEILEENKIPNFDSPEIAVEVVQKMLKAKKVLKSFEEKY